MRQPRKSANRAKLGIRWKWLQDRRCARHGHRPSSSVSQCQMSGVYWPICDRCGYAIEPDPDLSGEVRRPAE
jgi:hypothetical protein